MNAHKHGAFVALVFLTRGGREPIITNFEKIQPKNDVPLQHVDINQKRLFPPFSKRKKKSDKGK